VVKIYEPQTSRKIAIYYSPDVTGGKRLILTIIYLQKKITVTASIHEVNVCTVQILLVTATASPPAKAGTRGMYR
jgi:hypothetical protein